MSTGTLYTYPDSFRGYKSQIAANYSKFDLKVVALKADEKRFAKVPSFESNDKKVVLFESNAIAYYVANEALRGASDLARAEVLQWLEYSTSDIIPSSSSWVFPALSLVQATQAHMDKAKESVHTVLATLDVHLKTRTFLVGERLSLADIVVACDLVLLYQNVLDAKARAQFGNVLRWFTTCVNQVEFKKVLGDFKMCETEATFTDAKYQENLTRGASSGGAADKKDKKKEAKKEAKKAEEKKPKEQEKKKEVEAATEEIDEMDDVMREEPKSNDPFAAMPKGTFNMDEFKRTYSNKELSEALPYLWQNFDKENYSLWYCEYKYKDELTKVFMTSNLIGGMFQRLEKLRKNSFASMCVWGEDNNNTIAGVWFWKGHDLVFPLCTDWTTDYESYEWRKMNVDDENERKLADQVFSWEGDIRGLKYAAGKIFK